MCHNLLLLSFCCFIDSHLPFLFLLSPWFHADIMTKIKWLLNINTAYCSAHAYCTYVSFVNGIWFLDCPSSWKGRKFWIQLCLQWKDGYWRSEMHSRYPFAICHDCTDHVYPIFLFHSYLLLLKGNLRICRETSSTHL